MSGTAPHDPHVWAVVLAAGDGTRLASLTTDPQGNAVPKQFCSLRGDTSLVQDAVERAGTVVPQSRLCVIVAEYHRRYWQHALGLLPRCNIIVQPQNRGTAVGILLSALRILARDPEARIVFLPADHFVADENALARALTQTVRLLACDPQHLLLLGMEPDEPDPELGYIVPGTANEFGSRTVGSFVEKPPTARARELIARGALWNSFIFAAHAAALLELIREREPDIVAAISAALLVDASGERRERALAQRYAELPSIDFSRGILQGAELRLCVVRAAACGWTDLGTPKRVRETLRRPLPPAPLRSRPFLSVPAFINLAAQQARLQMTAAGELPGIAHHC